MNHGLLGLPGFTPQVAAGPWGNSGIALRATATGTQLIIRATIRGGAAQVAFPDDDLSAGDTRLVTISQPIAPLVIASGSTLGFSSYSAGPPIAGPGKLWVCLVDALTGPALAVVNCLSGQSIHPLGGTPTMSTLALGGGASAAHQPYSNSVIAGRPFIVLGSLSWESGLATAGTWNAGPTRARLHVPGGKLPGDVVQTRVHYRSDLITLNAATPFDNTVPQVGEGVQCFTATIVPTSASNLLRHSMSAFGYNASGTNSYQTAHIHKDGVGNAIAAAASNISASAPNPQVFIRHWMLAGSTASAVYTVRIGPHTGGVNGYINGSSAGSIAFSGVASSGYEIEELMA